jgi:F-type H+-transporting ATPase subunit gamma
MSDTLETLRRKINSAGDLNSVVHTMKVLAASNILQYEKAVVSLADFYRTVELGLMVCLIQVKESGLKRALPKTQSAPAGALLFGSDQGLVGQFNETLLDYALQSLKSISGRKKYWVLGEHMKIRLEEAGLSIEGLYPVPSSINSIAPLIGQILTESEALIDNGEISQLYIFYNKPKHRIIYEPTIMRLLPLDEKWFENIGKNKWPTAKIPEALNGFETTLKKLISNYLFVSLFRSCAESLASENTSRLAAMQQAEKNIEELLEELNSSYHRLRQSSIDEELFDVISGFEALSIKK